MVLEAIRHQLIQLDVPLIWAMLVAADNTPTTTRGLRQQLGGDVVAKVRELIRAQFGERLEQSVVWGEDEEAA